MNIITPIQKRHLDRVTNMMLQGIRCASGQAARTLEPDLQESLAKSVVDIARNAAAIAFELYPNLRENRAW